MPHPHPLGRQQDLTALDLPEPSPASGSWLVARRSKPGGERSPEDSRVSLFSIVLWVDSVLAECIAFSPTSGCKLELDARCLLQLGSLKMQQTSLGEHQDIPKMNKMKAQKHSVMPKKQSVFEQKKHLHGALWTSSCLDLPLPGGQAGACTTKGRRELPASRELTRSLAQPDNPRPREWLHAYITTKESEGVGGLTAVVVGGECGVLMKT